MNDEQLTRTMREIIDMASRTMFKETECTNEAINLAKAYADARESKVVTELKADNARWCKDFYKVKFELETANAEIKRLRDGIQKGFEKLAEIPYCSVLRTIFDNANGVQNGLESLLSPAPVTEGPKKTFSLQMYECNRCEWYGQVGESIETESYDVCPKCLSEDLTLLDSPKNEDQE